MSYTKTFNKLVDAYHSGKRFVICQGSTRSSKTYSVLQLPDYLHRYKYDKPVITSVVAMTLPRLKRGAIRDFKNILGSDWDKSAWNGTDFIYTYPNGSIIEFFSVDSEKVYGAQRDNLVVNEGQFINKETARQLLIRTAGRVITDFNPTKKFWIDDIEERRPSDCVRFITTYKDNSFLSVEQVAEIESNQYDTEWWKVFGLGLSGNIRTGYEFYSMFKYSKHVKEVTPIESAWHVSFDFNVVPYITATIWQIERTDKWVIRGIKEFCLKNPLNKTEDLASAVYEYLKKVSTGQHIFVYGDATGSNESTRSRSNDFDIIGRILRPLLSSNSWRVPKSNPRLKARRSFANAVLHGEQGIELMVSSEMKHTIDDFENVMEAPDGGKQKTPVKDEITGRTYEPYGHTSDTFDYFITMAFADMFKRYINFK